MAAFAADHFVHAFPAKVYQSPIVPAAEVVMMPVQLGYQALIYRTEQRCLALWRQIMYENDRRRCRFASKVKRYAEMIERFLPMPAGFFVFLAHPGAYAIPLLQLQSLHPFCPVYDWSFGSRQAHAGRYGIPEYQFLADA